LAAQDSKNLPGHEPDKGNRENTVKTHQAFHANMYRSRFARKNQAPISLVSSPDDIIANEMFYH
jgi:hypothetical protein